MLDAAKLPDDGTKAGQRAARIAIDRHRPILVFGGPYSNLQATEAVLAEARKLEISSDRILCTGDMVAYCGDPVATPQLIRNAGIVVIQGNCEEQLAAGEDSCGCGFSEGMLCDALSHEWYRFASSVLDETMRCWMDSLPHHVYVSIGGRDLAVVHGSPRQVNRFVFASTPLAEKAAELDAIAAHGVICGHCGIPFTQVLDGRLWHNAGVVGMPANDGTTSTWCSLLHADGDGIVVEHRRLHYDHQAAAARMRSVGLSHHYTNALLTGLWPSLDILPPEERASTGQALSLEVCRWPASATATDRRMAARSRITEQLSA
jgi:hypothetical protein